MPAIRRGDGPHAEEAASSPSLLGLLDSTTTNRGADPARVRSLARRSAPACATAPIGADAAPAPAGRAPRVSVARSLGSDPSPAGRAIIPHPADHVSAFAYRPAEFSRGDPPDS